MKDSVFAIVGLALAGGMLAAAALVPTTFETERLKKSRQVLAEVEKARRLLRQYDVGLGVESAYRDLLGTEAFTLLPDDVDLLLQDPPPTFDIEARFQEAFNQYEDYPEVQNLSRAEEELLKRKWGPEKWNEHRSPPPPGRMGPSMINQARQKYSQHATENVRLLDEALRHLNTALSESERHPTANRLKGIVLYQQGLSAGRQVDLMRSQLAEQRSRMRGKLAEVARVRQDTELVRASRIEERINSAQAEHKALLAEIEQQQNKVADLQSKVDDYQRRVEAAVARGEAAREAMEALQDLGVDLSNPDGFEEFRSAFIQQSNNYRAAVLEAYVAEHGTLDNATIDYTGDYVSGQYEPIIADQGIQRRRGLVHYRQDLETARLELDKMLETASRLEENINDLKNLRNNFEERARNAANFVESQSQKITEAFSAYQALYNSVQEETDKAIARFKNAEAAFQLAYGGVSDEERSARDERPADSRLADFHYSKVAGNQNWLKGQITAQHGDCYLRISLLLIGRYLDAAANLEDLGDLSAAKDAVDDWRTTAREAKEEAIAAAETGLGLLRDKAKGFVGEGNWIVAAQIGAAHYLKAILGVPLEAKKALEWYKLAVQNREDVAPQHAAMRDFIAARLNP